jgi:hypothetical protein
MKFKITEAAPITQHDYGLDYRVEVDGNTPTRQAWEVDMWLAKNRIPHVRLEVGVYYIGKRELTGLLLRWS